MIHLSTLEFLSDLRNNNYREWFHAQKGRYDEAKADVLRVGAEITDGINRFDPWLGYPDLRKCMFRIARDTRFSANKEPYKTNMGVVFSPAGTRGELSCYYIHVEPGSSFVSCGIYMPRPEILRAIRETIDDRWEEFHGILSAKQFHKAFGDLSREDKMLKRVPAGFDKESPAAEYLKLYHFYVQKPVSDEALCSPGYVAETLRLFETAKPLNDFLNRIIQDK